jgi:hypothetical protein
MGVAALICGILGLVGGFIPGVGPFTGVLAILAIIFGVIGRKKGEGGTATAGLVLGIIAIAVTVIVYLACAACVGAGASALSRYL